jgi:hypothetical protein
MWKPSTLEEAEEPEREHNERIVTVLKLTERLGLTEAGGRVSEDTGTNSEQQQLDKEL